MWVECWSWTPTGRIEGEVLARSATVAGQIQGNLKRRGENRPGNQVHLARRPQTRELVINEGAIFQGNCSMQARRPAKGDVKL